MDVSKLKECFLSIAAALLHAGAPVKMVGGGKTRQNAYPRQARQGGKKQSPRKSLPLKLNVIECHAHGYHMALALPHLLAFAAHSGWLGQVLPPRPAFPCPQVPSREREVMRPRILHIVA